MILLNNKSGLPRGLRNNNPGNIRRTGEHWQGEVPESEVTDRTFEQFRTMAYGYRALMKLLRNYRRLYGCQTVADMIDRWAPPVENDTKAYVAAVCRETGWAATYVPDVNSKEDMCALASAISLVENGRKAVAADVERSWALL